MPQIQLPEEIWIHVFGFLSVRDKLSVRSSCTCFKKLIDHWTLWKDGVVVLQRLRVYDTRFWKTIRQRRIKSIVIQKAKAKDLQPIVSWLSWVSSVTLVECSEGKALVTLGALKRLERLVIRQCCCRSLTSTLLSLRQLTHLCLCEVRRASISEISAAVSQLVNLTTLRYHEVENPLYRPALHRLWRNLPHLKHLSLRLGPKYGIVPEDYLCPTKAGGVSTGAEFGLSSLELLNYEDPCLSPDALSAQSSLTKLTVHYKQWLEDPLVCHLTKWLQGLHVLSELNISLGYPLRVYAKSIPRTVQRVSLMGVKAELESVRMMGEQVPDLLQLHLDMCCHDISDIIAEMPQIFPKLQVLKVRHHNIPVSVFLQLQHLPGLKQLVILDAPQSPSPTVLDLTQKLHAQTDNRIQVLHYHAKDQTTCACGFY